MMVKYLLAVLCLCVSVSAAGALDLKSLIPCRPAAARYCDHSDMTASIGNLLRCGAVLASLRQHISEPCRAVLKRYGQL